MKKLAILSTLIIALFAFTGFASAQDDDSETAFLGISYEEVDNGVEVIHVVPDSPAADAGLESGDVITAINDTPTNFDNVDDTIAGFAVGETISITVVRDDETLTLEATLAERPERAMQIMPQIRDMRGMMLSIDGGNIEFSEDGWTILELDETSPLTEAGLQTGDLITAVNGETLDNPIDLLRSLGDGAVTLTVERDDETLEVEVDITDLLASVQFDGMPFVVPFDQMPFFDQRGPRGNFGDRGPHGDRFPNMPQITSRARLGVVFITLDATTAAEYDSAATEGALILEVEPESAAEQAGLQVNDVITAVDGDVVDVERTLADRLVAYEPDDTITLDVLRDGETIMIEVTLGRFEQRGRLIPRFDFSDFMPDTRPLAPATPGA